MEVTSMHSRNAYRALMVERPELFVNPDGAPFEIITDEKQIRRAEVEKAAALAHHPDFSLDWASVGIVFMDQYWLVLRDAIRLPNVRSKQRQGPQYGTYIRKADRYPGVCGVVMLPIWQGDVLLVEHFRHATRSWHLELPRGFGSSADPSVSAERELKEELGAETFSLVQIGQTFPDTGASNERVVIFHATVEMYGRPDHAEGIRGILPTPIEEFEQMIRDGKLTDGFLLTAYALAKAKGLV